MGKLNSQNKEDSIYPLATREIVEAQLQDKNLKEQADKEGISTQLVENIKVLCKDGKMVVLKSLQHCAVAWFCHYPQYPGPGVFVYQCISKVSEWQSNHMSKSVRFSSEKM